MCICCPAPAYGRNTALRAPPLRAGRSRDLGWQQPFFLPPALTVWQIHWNELEQTLRLKLCASWLVLASMGGHAAVLDASSAGAGGTGITSYSDASAIRHNPAAARSLRFNTSRGAFSWSLGIMGHDGDSLTDDYEDAQDEVDRLEDKGNNIQSGDGDRLIQILSSMDEHRVDIDVDDTMVFAFMGEQASFGLSLGVTALASLGFDYAEGDSAVIRSAEASGNFQEEQLQSSVALTGVLNKSIGLTFGRDFQDYRLKAPFLFGATLKYQDIEIFDYSDKIANIGDLDDSDFSETHSTANLDIGVQKEIYPRVMTGLVIQDVFKQSLSGPREDDFDVSPQATAGISQTTDTLTFAMDIDLNKRKGFGAIPDRQNAKLGFRLWAAPGVQFRFGYRIDLENNYANTLSAGMGLGSGRGFSVDLSVMKGEGESLGAALQMGVML